MNRLQACLQAITILLVFCSCLDKTIYRPEDPRITFYNQRASTKTKSNHFKQAQEDYNTAIIYDAQNPLTRFNWSTNKMYSSVEKPTKEGDKPIIHKSLLKEALGELKTIQENSVPNTNFDKALSYQLGQAQTLNSDIEKALSHYYASLLKGNDPKLDKQSKINIEKLLIAKSQSGKGKGKGKGKSEDKKNGGGDDGDKIQENAKDGDDHKDVKQEAKFNQSELNEQQAKQILESVSSEEKNVQKKRANKQSDEKKNKGAFFEADQW